MAAPRLRLRLTSAAESIVRAGHPWVFAQSIRTQNRPGTSGELAVVYDREDKFLAIGLFDPYSPIRVRIIHRGKPLEINQDFWRERLGDALQLRSPLFDESTNGYRCLHGENDGFPGLVLDRYGETLVLKIYSGAWLAWLPDLTELIRHQLNSDRLVLRWSRNMEPEAKSAGLVQPKLVWGEIPVSPPLFLENGLRFEADVLRGQKTGFFLDQRENRLRVQSLSSGRAVLNAFSFSGGFSVYAARGGAASVLSVDISEHALRSAERNFALNAEFPMVARCGHETLAADVFEWLFATDRKFDLVVLDPPSLAKRETERAGALRAYGKLAARAIELLHRDGILVACSCSAHVSADEFFSELRNKARLSGRSFRELETTGHPADHPATFKEAEYLKTIYLQF